MVAPRRRVDVGDLAVGVLEAELHGRDVAAPAGGRELRDGPLNVVAGRDRVGAQLRCGGGQSCRVMGGKGGGHFVTVAPSLPALPSTRSASRITPVIPLAVASLVVSLA